MKAKKLRSITIILLLLPLCVALIGTGCKKEEQQGTDPAKAILGKWKLQSVGYTDVTANNLGYLEYLPDSVYRWYDYETKQYTNGNYWLDSLYLYNNSNDSINFNMFIGKHEYYFYNDKMSLESEFICIVPCNHIYKRIK